MKGDIGLLHKWLKRLYGELAGVRRDRGVWAATRILSTYRLHALLYPFLERSQRDHLLAEGFDEEHGTDTIEMIPPGGELGHFFNKNDHLVHGAQSTRSESVTQPLEVLGLDLSEFAFIDLGCGKGKPILVAAPFGFKKLVGIDISARCIEIARQNVRVCRPKDLLSGRIELLHGDVEDYEIPAVPRIFYLFNPFPAGVLEAVIRKLETSLRTDPMMTIIIYVNPKHAGSLESCQYFHRIPFSPEPGIQQAVRLYATRGSHLGNWDTAPKGRWD